MDDLERLGQALRARRDECWLRFDDAVSELIELHEIPADEILARLRRLAEDGDDIDEVVERSA